MGPSVSQLRLRAELKTSRGQTTGVYGSAAANALEAVEPPNEVFRRDVRGTLEPFRATVDHSRPREKEPLTSFAPLANSCALEVSRSATEGWAGLRSYRGRGVAHSRGRSARTDRDVAGAKQPTVS